jgi:ferredoxin
MKIHLDREMCALSGYCASIAPKFFAQDGEEPARLITDTVEDRAEQELVREAVATCPAVAITADESVATAL